MYDGNYNWSEFVKSLNINPDYGYYTSTLSFSPWGSDNIHKKRCKQIKRALKEYNMDVSVSRIFVGDLLFYKITGDHLSEDVIRKALDVPSDLVGIASFNHGIYLVNEKKLIDLKADDCGNFVFHSFDFSEASVSSVKQQLSMCGIKTLSIRFSSYIDKEFCKIVCAEDFDGDWTDIAKALCVDPDNVFVVELHHSYIVFR